MAPVEASSSIVLLEFQKSYGLGFVAPNGRVVTSFHVVSDEPEILVHLSDGRTCPVQRVSALDVRRDLAVLDCGVLDVAPARSAGEQLASDGARAYVFGMMPDEGRARWVAARIVAVQALGPSLTVYRLEGALPRDASGGPLVADDGRVIGVVTVADSDEGLVTLGVPWRYLQPLLGVDQQLPLEALRERRRRPPAREVPHHSLALLEGANGVGLEAVAQAIAEAIRTGAPAYNEGDAGACYRTYLEAAERLVDTRGDCPGVQQALREGLARAHGLETSDDKAWALRDAFDGLLEVIERYFRAHFAPARRGGKTTLLN